MEFKLRPWSINDIDSLVKHANNWNVAKNLTDRFPFPYTEAEARSFIEMNLQNDPNYIFVIDIEGQAVGAIGIHPQTDIHQKNAELGYWLAEPFWGQGIMTNAVKKMVRFSFDQLPIERIFARPFGNNIASQKVLEKAGFVLEGKLEKVLFKKGEYLDEYIYGLRRSHIFPAE